MRVILKPAGVLIVVGSIAALVTVAVVQKQKADAMNVPELAPIDAFKSKKKPKDPQSLFDTKDKMVPINVTEAGPRDWVVWGVEKSPKPIRKSGGDNVISDYELLIPDKKPLEAGKRGPTRGILWSNGNSVEKTTVTYAGVHVSDGNGFRFTVPATKDEQILRVFVGGYRTAGSFNAFVTDGSGVTTTKTDIALAEGYYSRMYEVKFKSTTPGQKLTVVWKVSGEGAANVSLQAATLE